MKIRDYPITVNIARGRSSELIPSNINIRVSNLCWPKARWRDSEFWKRKNTITDISKA